MDSTETKIVLGFIGTFYGLIFLITLVFYLKPPKSINWIYGYRTARSMKNEANWNFANRLAPKVMFWVLHLITIVAVAGFYLFRDSLNLDGWLLLITLLFTVTFLVVIPIIEVMLARFEKAQHHHQA